MVTIQATKSQANEISLALATRNDVLLDCAILVSRNDSQAYDNIVNIVRQNLQLCKQINDILEEE